MAVIEDFEKLDIRTGKILEAVVFPEAIKPAYKLTIDFGPDLGIKKSSARLTGRYSADDLEGKTILAVTNFPVRQIGTFMSEVLVLGVPDHQGETVLVVPEADVLPGARLY